MISFSGENICQGSFPSVTWTNMNKNVTKGKKTEKEGKVLLITALSLQPSTLLTTIK